MNTYPNQPAQRRHRNQRKHMIRRIVAVAIMVAMLATVVWLCTLLVRAICKSDESGPETSTAAILTPDNKTPYTVVETCTTATESPTDSTQAPVVFFALTSEQRTLIEQVVSAESRGEPYEGQVAVAQCILNACLKDGITPEQAIKKYHYTIARAEPTNSVREAVAAVFDRGEGVTEEPILYFYNPALCNSEFHESQTFVIEIANHRFFKEGPAE